MHPHLSRAKHLDATPTLLARRFRSATDPSPVYRREKTTSKKTTPFVLSAFGSNSTPKPPNPQTLQHLTFDWGACTVMEKERKGGGIHV